jgi:hypothetical protein
MTDALYTQEWYDSLSHILCTQTVIILQSVSIRFIVILLFFWTHSVLILLLLYSYSVYSCIIVIGCVHHKSPSRMIRMTISLQDAWCLTYYNIILSFYLTSQFITIYYHTMISHNHCIKYQSNYHRVPSLDLHHTSFLRCDNCSLRFKCVNWRMLSRSKVKLLWISILLWKI